KKPAPEAHYYTVPEGPRQRFAATSPPTLTIPADRDRIHSTRHEPTARLARVLQDPRGAHPAHGGAHRPAPARAGRAERHHLRQRHVRVHPQDPSLRRLAVPLGD